MKVSLPSAMLKVQRASRAICFSGSIGLPSAAGNSAGASRCITSATMGSPSSQAFMVWKT